MIQMPWTEETFPSFLCKIWNKRQPKNTSLKQFLCPFDNENWKEIYQFGYVGGPLSMLTLRWPHKNHWELFGGSRDFKNVLKGSRNMHYDISEMPPIKNEFPRAEGCAKRFCSSQTLVSPRPRVLSHLGTPVACISWAHAPWFLWSTLSKVLHTSIACNWLKSMYVGYVSNELKVCSPWEYGNIWYFLLLLFTNSRTFLIS